MIYVVPGKCIDDYIHRRVAEYEGRATAPIPSDLVEVVERMFKRCLDDKQYEQAVGVALESRRIDVVRAVVEKAENRGAVLSYCFRAARDVVQHRAFRQEVFRQLVELYKQAEHPDHLQIVQCLIFTDDSAAVTELLLSLVKSPVWSFV